MREYSAIQFLVWLVVVLYVTSELHVHVVHSTPAPENQSHICRQGKSAKVLKPSKVTNNVNFSRLVILAFQFLARQVPHNLSNMDPTKDSLTSIQ